jgi:CIC family chloride channel protein
MVRGASIFIRVVDRGDERKLLGIIGLRDLLSARTRNLEEERNRERVLRVRLPLRGKVTETASSDDEV